MHLTEGLSYKWVQDKKDERVVLETTRTKYFSIETDIIFLGPLVWKPEVRHEMPELTTEGGCENWRNLILSPARIRVSNQNYHWIQALHLFQNNYVKTKMMACAFIFINMSVRMHILTNFTGFEVKNHVSM